MRELLEKMIQGLLRQVEEKVPEKGAFPILYEREDVSAMRIGLSHLILKVTTAGEDERYLELAAVNYPSPYGAQSVVGYGSTQDILNRLREDELLEVLLKKVPKLADDIDDQKMHVW